MALQTTILDLKNQICTIFEHQTLFSVLTIFPFEATFMLLFDIFIMHLDWDCRNFTAFWNDKNVLICLHQPVYTYAYLALWTVIPGRMPFSYLEDIHMRFMKNYGRVAPYSPAYAMNDEFSRVLHQQMEFFSSNPSADTLSRVQGEVGEASITSYLHFTHKRNREQSKGGSKMRIYFVFDIYSLRMEWLCSLHLLKRSYFKFIWHAGRCIYWLFRIAICSFDAFSV